MPKQAKQTTTKTMAKTPTKKVGNPKPNQVHKLKLTFGKKNDDIRTPDDLYQVLNEQHRFDFDPCPANPTFDGLNIPWKKCNFVNPPFSQIPQWLAKGIEELQQGRKSVFLITMRSNSRYWSDYVLPYASEIQFIAGAVRFQGFKREFPIPLCIVVFDPARQSPASWCGTELCDATCCLPWTCVE